jgi:hypothetical protein
VAKVLSNIGSWFKRYWKPVVGVIVALAAVAISYVIERGIRAIGGGGIGGDNATQEQLHNNNTAIDSANRQLGNNAQAIDKLTMALDILRRARDRIGN